MFILIFITNICFFFGAMPEKIGLFVFGIALMVSPMILRRIFDRKERIKAEKTIN